jgi:hypothetical protein
MYFVALLCIPLLFWKSVMWAANAAKMGYQWKVGNGRKIKFGKIAGWHF